MAVSFYFDVHVQNSIALELRRRKVDVITAIEDRHRDKPDEILLERATSLDRVVFTYDAGFLVLARSWQQAGREFSGVTFAPHDPSRIGNYISDLELIARAMEPDECRNIVRFLPI